MNTFHRDLYRELILKIRCSKVGDKINPAKPIMLLALINLIRSGKVKNNKIYYEELKLEYDDLRTKYGHKAPIDYPFFYLHFDDFYHLKWKEKELNPRVPSAKFIRDNILYAYLDNAFWDILQEDDTQIYFFDLIENNFLN